MRKLALLTLTSLMIASPAFAVEGTKAAGARPSAATTQQAREFVGRNTGAVVVRNNANATLSERDRLMVERSSTIGEVGSGGDGAGGAGGAGE
ncbi:MAG: hypothetical protein WCH83_09290 [Alphaproteobacteria bacterium]